MSKNVKTYALLGLVLIVWGIIGFKVVKALSPQPEPVAAFSPTTSFAEPTGKRDTFALLSDYRDPFLGTLPAAQRKTPPRPAPKKAVPKKSIVYSGLVSQSDNVMFFVSIDGQQHIMSKNQKINDVCLLSGNEKSIRVRYNGITETIARSQ